LKVFPKGKLLFQNSKIHWE